MKEKFLVGELAKLFNISSDTLRHYDQLELLKPECDENNRYRYYNIRSIFKLSRILFLKNLGISLNEIHHYMKDKSTEKLLHMLRRKDEELDAKIHQLLNLKHKIQSKVNLLENYDTELNQIKVKTQSVRYGALLDMNELKDEYEIKQAFKKSEKYLKISSWLVEGQIYTSLAKKDMDRHIFNRFRYFIEIDPEDMDQSHILEVLPEGEYACITVSGPYSDMVGHYEKLVSWIDANHYEIVGDSIEKNIVDYDSTEQEADYVSEIQIPIRKKEVESHKLSTQSHELINVKSFYFSATGTTEKVVKTLANYTYEALHAINPQVDLMHHDFTFFQKLDGPLEYSPYDLVFVGVPVYAGRVPNVLLKTFKRLIGNGALAVPVVLYGNRNYDDALIELSHLLTHQGFTVIAAGAFIGEHAFSKAIATGRPDASDYEKIIEFSHAILKHIQSYRLNGFARDFSLHWMKGEIPHRPYYQPLDNEGISFDFKRITPETNLVACTQCMLCADECPTEAISKEDVSQIIGKCIKCCACVKNCPVQAKQFVDQNFMKHRMELEQYCTVRLEPEWFIKTSLKEAP